MNEYQGAIGHEERLALPGEATPSSRGRTIVVTLIIVALLALVTWAMYGRKKPDPAAGQKTEQRPAVTYVVPGRKSVDRTLNATGTLAARREMPVGVAGEGGMITRVLVEDLAEQAGVGRPPLLIAHRAVDLGRAGVDSRARAGLHEAQEVRQGVVHLEVAQSQTRERRELVLVLGH